jgi:hypothetical protein
MVSSPNLEKEYEDKLPMKTKMTTAQISKAGGDFELVQRDIPEPGPGRCV